MTIPFFHRNRKHSAPPPAAESVVTQLPPLSDADIFRSLGAECELYDELRRAVPVIDAAIGKIVRLCGEFHIVCEDARLQDAMDAFVREVPVGATNHSLPVFVDTYLESLLTYGNALGEIVIDEDTETIAGLCSAAPDCIRVLPGETPFSCEYLDISSGEELARPLPHPERILFTPLAPRPGEMYGVSVLHGLPALSKILLRIYDCIGKNYERVGNVRYAITYHPTKNDVYDLQLQDQLSGLAKEWQKGIQSSAHGEVRDFICAGDVDVRVIGADNPLLDTEIPVRQLLEQLIAKLSIPPFLLGLNWSSTERMSSQQADILTSELEYYRRVLEPMLYSVATAFLRLSGSESGVTIEWSNINLQDETELAQARLWTAQAEKLERENQARVGA